MNKLYLIAFLFTTLSTTAQYFSGEFLYKTTIVPKTNTVDVDSIVDSNYGDISSYLITEHYYKSTSFKNDQQTYSYTYHGDTKRMYDDYPEKEYITFRDSRKANYEYEEPIIYRDSTATILGYDTFMVAHPSTYGTTKSYYSNDLRVHYETFKEHAVGNWYNKLKTVNGSIPLKSITEFEEHTEIREVIKITAREVKSSEFDLPALKPLVASYWALDIQPSIPPQTEDAIACFASKMKEASQVLDPTESRRLIFTAIVNTNGTLSHITPYEKDALGLYLHGVDLLENCGLKFSPGEIDGTPVTSEIYFPLDIE
ncbi:MAG: hypothetical protein WDZ45_02610 [Flavobacteriaceae bacterium]